MPKHTPGPWKIDENEDLPLAVIEGTEEGTGIAEIGPRTPELIANAHLIAAAPDMLEALKRCGKVLEQIGEENQEWKQSGMYQKALAKAEKAVAKAEDK